MNWTLGGLLVVLVLVVAWRIRRAARADVWHEVGPDGLRLLEELDAHLDEYLLAHPDVAAGFARLRDAIRDEQKGDQG